jgi:hypothetical protein
VHNSGDGLMVPFGEMLDVDLLQQHYDVVFKVACCSTSKSKRSSVDFVLPVFPFYFASDTPSSGLHPAVLHGFARWWRIKNARVVGEEAWQLVFTWFLCEIPVEAYGLAF